MKNLIFIILVVVLILGFSLDANAGWLAGWFDGGGGGNHGGTGAPLDGGLLALLGAAGISYYIARKKKRTAK